ncbi:acyltransferase family protein [Undibacterium terreum]|uniref:Membrane protein n=1 Tax=Undibacterium terreum TaxID=1224302 RepID=A0A916XIR9_9BURK|nr:heparan-alpha-glucosaminide N-acetyltransferase domain-containing protein [Undibacterium terreum]GGC73480.1 membrane protein [Undibacterium terreum]
MNTARSAMRLSSIDALRGLTVAAMLMVNSAGDWNHVYPWLEHAEWNGCTPADFIFPFFLLIVGVSLSLALGPKMESGAQPAQLARTVLLRAARIVLLGIALHVVAWALLEGRGFRLLGVLQRIGICFGFAGLLLVYVRNGFIQWGIFAAILLGYWTLLMAGGSLQPDTNLADKIDTVLLGKYAYLYDAASGKAHDPEGWLSTLPSVATVLLGIRAGEWLRKGQSSRLAAVGIAACLAGAVWALVLPLNKQLWTPSFVLWTGGFALLAIGLAHYLIDLRGWPALGRSFGVNAIAAYAGSWIATCVLAGSGAMMPLYKALFEVPLTPLVGPGFASAAFAAVFTMLWWLLMRLFYRRGWRITI